MVQIKCLSNGLYSLKNSHIPFGMGFQPPPPYGGFPFEQHFSYKGASLRHIHQASGDSHGTGWIYLYYNPNVLTLVTLHNDISNEDQCVRSWIWSRFQYKLQLKIHKNAAHTSSWQFTWIKVTQMMMIRFSSELIPILQVCYSWESFGSLVESFESLVEKVRFKSFSTECQKLCYKIIFVWKLNVNKFTNAQINK